MRVSRLHLGFLNGRDVTERVKIIAETDLLATDYVPRELFDIHLQNIRERASSEKELTDERFEKLQAIMEKNLAEYKVMIKEVNGRIDVLDEKLEHVTDTLTVAISGLNERIDDIHQSQTLWFTLFGILIAVVPIAVAVVQNFITK